MLTEMIGERIQFAKEIKDWKEAIRIAAQPLLQDGYVKEEYIEAMIQNVIKNGAYIIIVPGFAMPHARPECGALKTGMSFLGLEKPVEFPGENQANVLLVLAAGDADAHLIAMSELADILVDDEQLAQLLHCTKKEEVKEVLR